MLIRDGATLVRDVADVIELLGPLKEDTGPAAQQRPVETPKSVAPGMRTTAAIHARILSRLGPSPIAEDQLIRDLKLAPASVTAVLVELELNGHVLRQSGGLISRTN